MLEIVSPLRGMTSPFGRGAAFVAPILNAQSYGSVMFPLDNGRTTDTTKNGQFTVNGFRTQASGPNHAFWGAAAGIVAICDPFREKVDATAFLPHVFATDDGAAGRAVSLRYYPRQNSNAAKRRRFEFRVQGETAVAAWVIESAVIPVSAIGPFAVYAFNDNTNGFCHVYDIGAAVWYDGAAVAKPASWIGVSSAAFTDNLVIGGAGNRVFPANFGPSFQSICMWRGSIGDILFANAAMTKADVESIVNGANPTTVATAAGATVRCHIPLTSAAALSSTITTTFTGLSLTQNGVVFAGPVMRRQGATNWITLDRYGAGEHFPVEFGSANARVRLKGKVGGLTGNLEYRVIRRNGVVLRDWANSGITVSAGAFDGHVTMPEFTDKMQVAVRMTSNTSIVASSHADCTSGPVVELHGQSELMYATFQGWQNNMINTALSPPLPANADTITFAHILDMSEPLHGLYATQESPGHIGDGNVGVIHCLRSRTQRSFLIRVNGASGTSPLALMNDADTTRNWSDLVALRSFTSARAAGGEHVVTGHVVFGWEASLSPANVMPVAYRPLLTGVGAGSGSYDRTNNIPTANVNRWLFDGSSSATARAIVTACNRDSPGLTGATDTDQAVMGTRRDHMRAYSHIYPYLVGPETTAHRMEGETAAGALPSVASSHQEPGVWEGAIESAMVLGEAILQAVGAGTFPAPVFFETVTAGSAANRVRVRLGLPRLNPGANRPEGTTGYDTTTQSGSYTYAMHVKKTGGDPGAGFEARIRPNGGSFGAWSKSNVTSGTIIDAAQGIVELTLAASLAAGDTVEIVYLPGSTGRYATATITQENWRSGILYFNGTTAPASITTVAHLLALGWQVAGSNQALSFTA